MIVFVGAVLLAAAATAVRLGWRWTMSRAFIICPFLAFVATELRSAWPANLALAFGRDRDIYPLFVSALALIAFCLAYLVSAAVVHLRPAHLLRFQAEPVVPSRSRVTYVFVCAVMGATLVAIGTYQYRGLPPLTRALTGLLSQGQEGFVELNAQRRQLTKGYVFGADDWRGQGVIAVLMSVGWLYLGVMLAALRARYRTRGWTIALGASVLAGVIYLGGVGERAPMVELLAGVLLSFTLIRYIRTRHLVLGAVALLIAVFLVGPLKGQFTEVGAVTTATETFGRVAFGNGTNNVLIIEAVEDGRLGLGRGVLHYEKARASLPGVGGGDQPFANRLAQIRNPGARSTFATPTNFGFIYADFGPAGVLVLYAGFGAAAAVAQRVFIVRRSKTPENTAMLTLVSFSFAALSFGTLWSAIISVSFAVGVHHATRFLLRVMNPRTKPEAHVGGSERDVHAAVG